ncbi:unnamed protein product [Amoebophrya sp. A25]|nr:unnamed protein product [Amoebophrya sp. A25]|eukprot:GSA25T00024276001.1
MEETENRGGCKAFLAGVLAGLSTDFLLHPFDHLKCLYQTTGSAKGLFAVSSSISGFKPWLLVQQLYRGFPAVAVLGAPANGIFYTVYEALLSRSNKDMIRGDIHVEVEDADADHDETTNYRTPSPTNTDTHTSPFLAPLLASSAASVASNCVYCPMEVVKETAFSKGISTRETVQGLHLRSLYRGFFWANATWVPYLGLYFTLYEGFRGGQCGECTPHSSEVSVESRTSSTTSASRTSSAPSSSSTTTSKSTPSSSSSTKSSFVGDLTGGLAAGTIAAGVTYPLDLYKTRVQSGWTLQRQDVRADVGHKTPWARPQTLMAQQHLRGLTMRILWLSPASALTISFYQFFYNRFL